MEGQIIFRNGAEKKVSESDFVAASQSTFDIQRKQVLPLSYLLRDPANICTLVGAVCTLLAVHYFVQETYYLGFCLLAVGSVADILDGFIARRTPQRDSVIGEFGALADGLVDVMNGAVAPLVFISKIAGQYSSWPVLCGIIYAVAVTVRLAYFELVGMQTYHGRTKRDSFQYYIGFTKDIAVGILSAVVHLMPFIDQHSFIVVFSVMLVAMAPCLLTQRVISYRIEGMDVVPFTGFFITQVLSFLALHVVSTSPTIRDRTFYQGAALILQAFTMYPLLLRFTGFRRS